MASTSPSSQQMQGSGVPGAVSLLQLGQMIQRSVAANPQLQNVWVAGETSDLRLSGGHCYLELVEKDREGRAVARARANIWASLWPRLSAYFYNQTGVQLSSGIKVLVRVSANYHPAYGMSLTVTSIDPSYTMGDAVRRRNEILARLRTEGIIDLNRTLQWARPALKIAVISAPGAAGYGDFINQLYNSRRNIRFTTKLFPAVMQGERTSAAVIDALESVAFDSVPWDAVVIIRGGGATSDLASFDDYDLAAHIANFPVPVVVGIGHERDITVLDYVANMRVKTPTAAAEWLIGRAEAELDTIERLGNEIYRIVSERISGNARQLAYLSALIPGAVGTALERNRSRLQRASMAVVSAAPRVIAPALTHLNHIAAALVSLPDTRIKTESARLLALQTLVDALSPEAVLARGFSMTTTADGKIVRDNTPLANGDVIITRMANTTIESRVLKLSDNSTKHKQ